MRLNDRPADAKPHAGAVRFGRKERVEHLFRVLRRKSYAGITHRHKNLVVFSSLRLDDQLSYSITRAERQWASRYEPGDVIRYARGSEDLGIERGSYARVVAVNPADDLLTVKKQNVELVTYNPKRLGGVSAYRETEREFAVGDRIQFTAPDKQLQVANRDLATIEAISPHGEISARLDDGRTIEFSNRDNRHFDHGYAVTSHSSQGLTADRVLVHVDTSVHPDLINSRFAYVSVSRASVDARIYTNNAASLSKDLSHEVGKSAAMEVSQSIGQATQDSSKGLRL